MFYVNYFSFACSLTVPLNDRRVLRLRSYAEAAKLAGAVVLDLEDSVPDGAKGAARELLAEAFDFFFELNKNIFCRVNNTKQDLRLDLAACAAKPFTGVQIPKVSGPKDFETVQAHLLELGAASLDIVPIIETLAGIKNIEEIFKFHRPPCVYFGPEDMSHELGVEPSPESLWYVAHRLLFEAACLQVPVIGLLGPLCYFSGRDRNVFKDLLALSKKVGFHGAPAVHPRQVQLICDTFRVSEGEKETLVRATKQAQVQSIFSLDGLMYGPPMMKRLRKRIERA